MFDGDIFMWDVAIASGAIESCERTRATTSTKRIDYLTFISCNWDAS